MTKRRGCCSLLVAFAATRCLLSAHEVLSRPGFRLRLFSAPMRTSVSPLGLQHQVPEPVPSHFDRGTAQVPFGGRPNRSLWVGGRTGSYLRLYNGQHRFL